MSKKKSLIVDDEPEARLSLHVRLWQTMLPASEFLSLGYLVRLDTESKPPSERNWPCQSNPESVRLGLSASSCDSWPAAFLCEDNTA
jgi:hypothetical protein